MEILQPSWRGRSTNIRKDANGRKYTAMVGKNSLLYIPIHVLENSTYRVTIELCRESGNGIVFCNIYGNKNFDFPARKIECSDGNWCTYDIDIETKSFPKTVPMMFRIWRPANGTGTILVRKVVVELLENKIAPEEEPIIVSTENVVPTQRTIRRQVKPHRRRNTKIRPRSKVRSGKRRLGTPFHNIFGGEPPGGPANRRRPRRPKEIVPILPIGKFMPKVDALVPGENGIKNSVIISLKDRAEFLDRTLLTYAKQTMRKEEFEIVVVDDNSSDDILGLCKRHAKASGLQFQYIRADSNRGTIPQRGWTPALTNNIGFRKARGSVFIITGPETLQRETNMERTWSVCHDPVCVYGVVYKSDTFFVDAIRKNSRWIEYEHFTHLMRKHSSYLERPSTGGFWWYYAATRKEYIMTVQGVDERFMLGITAEDDDFAERMRFLGLKLTHDFEIIGIHQNHSREDRVDAAHGWRFNETKWRNMRAHNMKLLYDRKKSGDPIVNKGIDWGTDIAILDMEVF